jgi:light-regulated signal transduction histidine kinase (bacteriophytochrome)
VLENLLGNAWKFTARVGQAQITLGSSAAGEFFVRDNGAGFEMAYADRLFSTFQRLHDAEEFPGTGIGLATVARAISRQGGRVWAQAAPGEGATFYFSLPTA